MKASMICYGVALASVFSAQTARAQDAPWGVTAPEALPPVTVRWEDPGQKEIFVVEGRDYRCRVATNPARILSLQSGGANLLGPEGIRLGFTGRDGRRYTPAPPEVIPNWNVWRRKWVPASDARARMNVWSAGPYYWDAHLLDIPLVDDGYLKALSSPAGPALADWTFDRDNGGWAGPHNATIEYDPGGVLLVKGTGDDPYIQSPSIDTSGPVMVTIRMRTRETGGAALYWIDGAGAGYSAQNTAPIPVDSNGEWREYTVSLPAVKSLQRLRFDPPGKSGTTEINWIRVQALPEELVKVQTPLRGHLVFHAHPDHLRIELKLDLDEGQATPGNAYLHLDGAAAIGAARERRPIVTLPGAGRSVAIMGGAGTKFDAGSGVWTAPLEQGQTGSYWIVRPLVPGAAGASAFDGEFDLLPAAAVQVTGGRWLGYDGPSGLYRVQAEANLPAFSFEEAFTNPGRRIATDLRIRNGAKPRSILVKCLTGVGNLEAAVLTDTSGFPLPVPVQVSKNFAGEMEEPDDSAFGDSYFPLSLAASDDREFRVLHLNQNWGNHLIKQVSSIRFFNIYWHLSTGASETTCFTHDWMKIGRSGILHIPDFRPLSGPFWPGQPQHECFQWPGFLQYNDGKARLVYERTVFDSISPNLARFTMHYHTSDDAASARLKVMEIPQRDEMRTFVSLRYDWQKPVEIDGDARESFRWLNIFEKRFQESMLWTDAAGSTRTRQVTAGDQLLLGEPLGGESPFAASQGSGDGYHCLVLVRGFRARLGGKDFDRAALSARFGKEDGNWWLTIPAEKLSLKPGDFVEADVMLMPHGEPSLPALKPERERMERFGAGLASVTDVSIGKKISDFPAIIRADDEAALFTLQGGFDYMPIIVQGFRHWGVPLLWRGGVWQDQQVHGGDGYQVEPDGSGGYRFVLVYPIRTGQKQRLTVTRAHSTTGISRMRDDNGSLVLEAPRSGEFTLKAPVLFAPGRNIVSAGSPLIAFTGTGTAVRSAPIAVTVTTGQTTVEVNADGTEVRTQGAPAALTFSHLLRGGMYEVSIDGTKTRRSATDGALQVQAPGPSSRVTIVPVAAK